VPVRGRDRRRVLARSRADRGRGWWLDLSLPRGNASTPEGGEAPRRRSAVLILTVHSEDQVRGAALRAGARLPDCKACPEQLVQAIRKVYRGGRFRDPGSGRAARPCTSTEDPEKAPPRTLSNREFEVLPPSRLGRTSLKPPKHGAERPRPSVTYRSRILEKMSMKTNGGADPLRDPQRPGRGRIATRLGRPALR